MVVSKSSFLLMVVGVGSLLGSVVEGAGSRRPNPLPDADRIPVEELQLVGEACESSTVEVTDLGIQIHFKSFVLTDQVRVSCNLALPLPAIEGKRWLMESGTSAIDYANDSSKTELSAELFFAGQRSEPVQKILLDGEGRVILGGAEGACGRAGIGRANVSASKADRLSRGTSELLAMTWALRAEDCLGSDRL